MRAITLFLVVLGLVGCQNIQGYSPSGGQTFDAYPVDQQVDYYVERDQIELPHTIIGTGETRASGLPEALGILRNMARKHGADAFYGVATTGIGYGVSNYTTTFIRYDKTEGSAGG